MKIILRNVKLEFQSFSLEILDHKEGVTITNGQTSAASNISTVIGNKYAALFRVKSITTSSGGNEPLPYLYEGSGTPRLGTMTYKETTQQGYRDYYMTGGQATMAGIIGGSCSGLYTITYDIILFDITAHPEYESIIPNLNFDEVSEMISN